MTVIAFDPGGTTGVAIKTLVKGFSQVINPSFPVSGTPIVVPEDTPQYLTVLIKDVPSLWEIIDRHQPDTVVYENFSSSGLINKDGQATLRLIGAIEAVCFRLGITTVYQMPQERYPFLVKAKAMLKQVKKTPIVHEIDALAHLLLYEDRVSTGVQDRFNQARQRMI